MTEVNFESEGRARSLRESITYSMDTQVNSYSTRPAYYFFSPEKMIKSWTRATKVDSNFIDNYGIPMGMELEVERRAYLGPEDDWENIRYINKDAMWKYYIDRFGTYDNDVTAGVVDTPVQFFIAKEDGSLSNGIEFVSQPMTLGMWSKIPLVFEELTGDYAAYHRRTTGIHIHIPKGAFEDSHLHRWLHLMKALGSTPVNHRRLTNVLALVGQRQFNNWARFIMPEFRNVKSSLAQVAIDRVNHDGGRYKFLNFLPSATIELRFFKANMQTKRILKNLEFVDATYEFTKNMDNMTQCNINMFTWYLRNHSVKYQNLLEYLDAHSDKIDWDYKYDLDSFELEAQENMREGEMV